MKKKITLLALSFSTAVAVGTVTVISQSDAFSYLSNAETKINAITIDVNNPEVKLTDSTYVTYKSQKGNSFDFVSYNVSIVDGAYCLNASNGRLLNDTAINGITSIVIDSPVVQSAYFGIKLEGDSGYTGGYNFDLEIGENTITFDDFDPTFFMLSSGEDDPFFFTSMTIYYSCQADYPSRGLSYLKTLSVEGYSIEKTGLVVKEGTLLTDISLTGLRAMPYSYSGFYIEDEYEILSIAYEESDSAVVLPGENTISITFVYNQIKYIGHSISLFGYESIRSELGGFYLVTDCYLVAETDDIPDNFTIQTNENVMFYDSNDQFVFNSYCTSIVKLTSEMVVLDEHPFTLLGNHIVKVTYHGASRNLNYQVYDPAVCNIRAISYYPYPEVNAGTSNAEFLEYIPTLEAHIYYYEDDGTLPHEIYLPAECFKLSENAFSGASSQVNVSFTYEGYEGSVWVIVKLQRGENPVTYTASEDVNVLGLHLESIVLYENGVLDLMPQLGTDNNLSYYSIENGVLTASYTGMEFKLNIDEENNTFSNYISEHEVVKSFLIDFSALGAPELYDAYIYDDGTMSFFMNDMEMNFPFTYDEDDNTIVYFVFASMSCKGVLNTETNIMVVTQVY